MCGHTLRLLLLRIFSYFRLVFSEVTGVVWPFQGSLAVYDFTEKYTENGRACMSSSLPFPKERGSSVK